MEIIKIPLSDLTPDPNNAKDHPDWQIEQIKNSIEQFGNLDPIGVWGDDNLIVEGHGRYEALKELGFYEAECIRLDWLTEEERKAYALAHNKLTMNSGFIPDALDMTLAAIGEIDMSQFGFDIPEEEEPTEITDDEIPEEVETRCKLGDIWQLGDHRLMCGDSTDPLVIDKLMDGQKAGMILSDPPYGMKLDTDFSTIKGSMKSLGRRNHTEGNKYDRVIGDNDDFSPTLISTFFKNFGYCKEMFLFGADYFAEILPDKNDGSWLVWDKRKESQADVIGSEFELIWSRNKHKRRMLRHDWFGFLSSENGADARNRVHPTQKPVTLLADIINQWGKGVDDIVDLYGGSGSTLIACEQLNRKCYMCELDPHYCDVIIQRWENLTGGKAVRINDAG